MKETEILERGGVILYPTDTIWGLGCDATNRQAIERIIRIKGRPKNKSLIILVKDTGMLSDYVESIPEKALELMRTSLKPLTIIYPGAKNLPTDLLSNDGSIGIRVVGHEYCQRILSELKRPIVSTSANFSGEESPKNYSQISPRIMEAVDYISMEEREDKAEHQASSIIRITDEGNVDVIRE